MNKIKLFVSSVILLLAFSFMIGEYSSAATAEVGGSAAVNGKITFYEGEQIPDESQPDESQPLPTPKPKPKPSLPQTGEQTSHASWLGVLFVGLVAGYGIYRKRKGVSADED